MWPSVLLAALCASRVYAQSLSIYPWQPPSATPVAGAPYVGYNAYNPTTVPPPTGLNNPNTNFGLQITAQAPGNIGPPVPGSLFGFSIEMSIADVVIGSSAGNVQPSFLNLMSTLKARSGPPVLRVGGNTQEKAALVDSLPKNAVINKLQIGPSGVTNTPTILFTTGFMEAMKTVTDLLGITWYMGVPFNQTTPARLDVVAAAHQILGDSLVGWQLGNEPDLYQLHGLRVPVNEPNYTQQDYMNDVTTFIQEYNQDPRFPVKNNLGGPSICCLWNETQLIDDFGYLSTFRQSLNSIIIEHYPTDNCVPSQHNPQEEMLGYTAHSAVVGGFANQFIPVVQAATAAGLPVVMMEMNTASCNGFLGVSDAFASALWAVDVSLQMGFIGTRHLMMHMGGQGVYYNPFIPPPFNATAPFEWTVGPIFYSAVMVAEALGPSNTSQIVDLGPNNGQDQTPGYAIYEQVNGKLTPVRVVLINYITDPSGASDYTANLSLDSGTPTSVSVRFLVAPSVSSKTENITYAGRTFGGQFGSDGLLHGTDDTQTVQCANGVCPIKVPAPGAALVFLTPAALAESVPADSAVQTFTTSTSTVRRNTATVPQAVLATTNGIAGAQRTQLASTSFGSVNAARGAAAPAFGLVAAALVVCLSTMVARAL